MFNGFIPNFTNRSEESELMDGSAFKSDELVENLADLRRVNRYLGGQGALTRHLFPMIDALGKKHVRLLDVGTGSADIPARIIKWARGREIKIEFVVLDLNEIAAREARLHTAGFPEIEVLRADAMVLPFEDGSFDFVIASLLLHHFDNQQAAELIKKFSRLARVAFIINDLRRHPVAYYSIKLLAYIFTKNRLIRNDSAVSVLRGFTERDFSDISKAAQLKLEIFRLFPYRFILIGQTNNI